LLLLPALAAAQRTAAPPREAAGPTILTEKLPRAALRSDYDFTLQAKGGTEPYKWAIEEGKLPPGMKLSEDGVLSGRPAAEGEFRFLVSVTDSSARPEARARWMVLRVVASLSIEWKHLPQLQGDTILGAVEVTNSTDDDFDLTVIVVAVNEVGKAFALGYQHFTLKRQTKELIIEFGSSLPRGAYVVHADAVAEIAAKERIHRARMQTPEPLRVP
jgi:hypothetical protein